MKELSYWQEIQDDLKKVEAELLRQVEICDPVISQATLQLVKAGGKRLRPAFTILAAKCCGANLKQVLPLAVALEMVHMSTLVHDDIIDASPLRRGQPTVWARWGKELSLHAGDYLFARSLKLIAAYDNPAIPSILASVSVKMVQGEICQLSSTFDINVSLREYLDRICRKTALLIAACCQVGAVVAGAREEYVRCLYHYGRNLGIAFQITDDVLDMTASPNYLGKPVGSDLRQGVITLPAIHALKTCSSHNKLANLLTKRDKTPAEIKEVIAIIRECGGIDYALKLAERYLTRARQRAEILPENKYREILMRLTHYIKTRDY